MSDANEIDSAHETLQNTRAVAANPAFQIWKSTLEAQINGRKADALNPLDPDGLAEHNYRCGEAAGMMAAIQLWDLMQEAAKEAVSNQPAEGDE